MPFAPFRSSLALLAVLATGLAPQAPRYVARPDARFSVPDSVTNALTLVMSMAVGADGSLFVADRQLPHVIQLEPDGHVRRMIGRPGGGPGEFYVALVAGFYRDSLWVYDPGHLRVSLFPLEGDGVNTLALDALQFAVTNAARPKVRQGIPAAILPDGNLLMQEIVPMSDNPADGDRSVLLLRADRALYIMDTLAVLPAGHTSCNFVYRDGATFLVQPWGDDPLYSRSADGRSYLTVTRTAPASAAEQRFTVTLTDAGTGATVTREIPYQPRALPLRAVDSVISRVATGFRRGQLSTPVTADSLRRRLFRPDYYPPVERASIARDGTIWLRVRFGDGPADGSEYLVLSPRGFVLRRITAPADFTMFEANRDTLWGVRGESGDELTLARFTVERE